MNSFINVFDFSNGERTAMHPATHIVRIENALCLEQQTSPSISRKRNSGFQKFAEA
jgi:hypothetical protein